jgi:monoamine oxidase
MDTRTLIIGGGLSGLALADTLHSKGHPFLLLEARDRIGGRILSETIDGNSYDLGPAWFWPGQPLMDQLVRRLKIARFEQFTDGLMTVEDRQGDVQHGRAAAAMAGSWRLDGGMRAIIDGIARNLPVDTMRLQSQVKSVTQTQNGIQVRCEDGTSVLARTVVFAMPLRLISLIDFSPALSADARTAMVQTPTWMAGQAKAVAVYDSPFWRKMGLSGDAMSRHGPMVEIHDASPFDESGGALFGFLGVPPEQRYDEVALQTAIVQQLVRLFGPDAGSPKHVLVKDWATDPFTAMQRDLEPLIAHPIYGYPSALSAPWGDQIRFAGSEVAETTGGFLEGALETARTIADRILG